MKTKIFPWVLVALMALAAVFLRTYALTLPQFGFLAEAEVHQREMASVREALKKTAPTLDTSVENRMVAEIFKSNLKSDRRRIETEIGRRAEALKERYRDAAGRTYLGGIDSYYWLRLLRNLLERGHIGDRSAGGVEYDELIGNPMEAPLVHSAHIWLGLLFYKAASFFNPAVPLEAPLFYIPLVLTVVIAFASFWTARRLGACDLGALAACFAVTFSPIFLTRSAVEWFDTDIYSVLFPLLAFGVFLCAFGAQTMRRRAAMAALAALFLALYSSTWKGWWFIFDLMMLAGLLFVLNQKLSEEERQDTAETIRGSLAALAFLFLFTAIFVTASSGVSAWKDSILEPLRLANVLEVTPQASWPNVYKTVAELSPVKPDAMMDLVGGNPVFLIALGGLLYLFLVERAGRRDLFGFGILCLIFWIISCFYTGLTASRFVLLLVVPVGLAFGLGVSFLYQRMARMAERFGFRASVAARLRRRLAARCVATAVFSFYMGSSLWAAHLKMTAASVPAMDDHWQEVLLSIRDKTPKDAVINSWWDFGHWFKAIARRRVLFDGMTQNTPYAYWVARALLTGDEKETVAILRMINTSGNKAADILEHEAALPASRAVALVRRALMMTRQEAEVFLIQEGVASARAQKVLAAIFPRRLPEVYFIVSSDMPMKIGPISYIGNWNFERVETWFQKQKLSGERFLDFLKSQRNLSDAQARQVSAQIAFFTKEDAPRWYSQAWGYVFAPAAAQRDEKLLFFDNGLVVNEENNHTFVSGDFAGRRGVPQSLISFSAEGKLEEAAQKNATLPYSALLLRDEKDDTKDIKSLLLEAELAKSMLIRLYYFGGTGLQYFRLFHKTEDDKGNRIYVYKVEWPGEKI